ncbi:WD repeat domain-containing protein 83-like [Dreissena polymorpha]|uniref:WD repeat domain-containing protein 83-like n=1 Tax=Dreissena polymorpha TaxID=45954 RepID=UPI002264A932|nr:WD repeat domain-containing protein 83-like [Dreissena polymorpha]
MQELPGASGPLDPWPGLDGTYCLSCGSDKSVKLWNPHRNLLLKSYIGHGFEVLDAQGSSDNSQICSCSMDKTVMVFDVATGKSLRKYRGHAGTVNCVRFNEESTLVLSGSIDSTIRIYDLKSRKMEPIQILDEAKDGVTCIQVSDHEILSGSADGRIRRYDLRVGKMTVDLIGKSITSVTFTRDGQCVLVSTLDSSLKLMDKDTGEMLNEYVGHTNTNYRIDSCLNSKDTHILSGSENGSVYIWDLIEGKVVHHLPHEGQKVVHSLTFHPSENCLITAAGDTMYVWKSRHAASLDT